MSMRKHRHEACVDAGIGLVGVRMDRLVQFRLFGIECITCTGMYRYTKYTQLQGIKAGHDAQTK